MLQYKYHSDLPEGLLHPSEFLFFVYCVWVEFILVVSPSLSSWEPMIALLVLNVLHLSMLLLALAAPSSSVLGFIHTLLL